MPSLISHFLSLVQQGTHPGSSDSEKAARKLAVAIVDIVPGLDAEAICGLKEWIDYCKTNPSSAQDWVGFFPEK